MTTIIQRWRDRTLVDSQAFDRRLIAPLLLGAVLNPINSSLLAVALVPIGLALGASASDTAWLVTGLYLATAVGQPVVGRLVDRYGPRPLFLCGAALVGIGGLVGGLAPSLGVLVLARVLIGIGTCAGYPAAMFLIRRESERTGLESPSGILAGLAVSTQVTSVIGPTLGGFLIGLGGWRTIFLVNLPVSAAALVLGWRRLPRGAGRVDDEDDGGIDVLGIVLFSVMLVALMLFLMRPELGRWWILLISLAAAVAFGRRELRTADPFLDLRVLGQSLPLVGTYLRQLLVLTVSYAFLYGYPQWLETTHGLSASTTGLVLLPIFLTAVVVTSISGRRSEVWGKLLVGGVVLAVACSLVLVLNEHSPLWALVAVSFVIGVPQGLLSLANQNALYHQADPARMGSSAGLLRTFTYLGALVSAAANAVFFRSGVDTTAVHELSVFMLGCVALFLVLVLVDRSLRHIGRTSSATATPSTPGRPS